VFLKCGNSARDFRQASVGDDADSDFEIGRRHRWGLVLRVAEMDEINDNG